MIRRPPRSTRGRSSAASDVYKRQTQGIDVLEGPSKLPSSALDKKFDAEMEEGEEVELDLTPGALEKTNDPVRMYLREMGTVPLLTREGEVEIAKRIERGQLRVLKAISRSPIVIREIAALGEDLEKGVRSIKAVSYTHLTL